MRFRRAASYMILTFLCAAWIGPFYATVIAALKTNREFATSPFWVPPVSPIDSLVENLRTAWVDGSVQHYFFNSLIYACVGSVAATLVASLAAFPIARLKFRGSSFVFYLIMCGTFFPFQMYIIPLLQLWIKLNLYNTNLGMQLVYTAICIPFVVFLLRNYLITIPSDLQDAARIDGLSYFGMYWRIFLPLSLPAIAVGITFQFIWIWNDLLFGLVLTSSPTTRNIMAGITTLSGSISYTYATLSAVSLIAATPTIVVFILLQRYVTRGILLGAVKK